MKYRSAGGASIPVLGFGTANLYGDTCEQAVRDALEMGYRHVDTADFYDNHRAVGRGIDSATVPRSEVFLTTKVWRTDLDPDSVHDVATTALEDLDKEYVDLLLIHAPSESVPIEETIRAMNGLQREGAVRHIGVSNFSIGEVAAAMDASQTPIVTNQVRYEPETDRQDLLQFCLDEGVLLTAYSPLGTGNVLENQTLKRIAGGYGKSAAQIALRWLIQQPGVLAIPKAATRDHRYENLQIFDFSLTDEEMREIFDLTAGLQDPLAGKLGL